MSSKRVLSLVLPLLLAAISLFAFSKVAALAGSTATIHTVCASGCDFSSIQAAIDVAAPGDTLDLAGETFTEPFTVTKNLTVEGAGYEDTVLQAAAAPGIATSRVITIAENVTATITGVTIRYGSISGSSYPESYGGGVLNKGSLTIDASKVISNNGGKGGGIFTDHVITVTNSFIMSNTAEYYGAGIFNNSGAASIVSSILKGNVASSQGGGIYSFGDTHLEVSHTTFEENVADSVGGGIRALRHATTSISDSIFRDNAAENDGGGISNYWGVLTVTNTLFEGNVAGDEGGAIENEYFESSLSIWDSGFHNNGALYGGAIRNDGSELVVVRGAFSGNTATRNGGAIDNTITGLQVGESTFSENRADYYGGAIYNSGYHVNHPLWIYDTTFYSNSCGLFGGGVYNTQNGRAIIAGSTFDSNRADKGGGIGSGQGTHVELANATLSSNSAEDSGGGLYLTNAARVTATNVSMVGNSAVANGGGVAVTRYSDLYLSSSIVAYSPSGGDCYHQTGDPFGNAFDLGYNLVEDGTCIDAATSFSAPPQLGPLADNGGKTETHSLLEGSPAIDAIPTSMCWVTEDQRGVSRPSGAGCDIGAFELVTSYEIFLPLTVRE